jgi:hypothetical protein
MLIAVRRLFVPGGHVDAEGRPAPLSERMREALATPS